MKVFLPVRKLAKFISVSLLSTLFLVFLLPAQADAALSFRLTNQFPPNHHVSQGMVFFADKVKEYSAGEITVVLADTGSLYRDAEVVKAIRNRSVEAGVVPVNKWSGLVRAVDIFEVPFVFKELSSLEQFLSGGAREVFDASFERFGAKVLFWVDYGNVQFFNNKRPLKSVEDFKGLTMRAFSAADAVTLESLGAAPTIISSSELYLSLQRGTIDGTTTGMPAAISRKVVEVQKYMTHANYSSAEFLVQANLKWWNKLKQSERDIIMRAAAETEQHIRTEVARYENDALESIKKYGIEVHTLTDAEREELIKATANVRADFLKNSGETGQKLMKIADESIK